MLRDKKAVRNTAQNLNLVRVQWLGHGGFTKLKISLCNRDIFYSARQRTDVLPQKWIVFSLSEPCAISGGAIVSYSFPLARDSKTCATERKRCSLLRVFQRTVMAVLC
ncbi:hypothetical protein [Limnohabitans sp. DM1]|uniref:hypothetical protein n=1 Tax=Limnohabitans sp. DM1 TaxID=1597955 RepID=UPI000A628D81|nr:hypothetical protein [Limnohabitans sp. DM1]